MACWLQSKTVILTGATGGIGREMARILIEKHGCLVIGIGRDKQKAQALCNELGEHSSRFVPYCFDISHREQWYNFATALEKKNIIPDLLINNAGMLPRFRRFASDSSACDDSYRRAADGPFPRPSIDPSLSGRGHIALEAKGPVQCASSPMEDALRAMRTNYLAPLYALEALLPLLLRSSTPGLVNVSSSAALASLPGTTGYSASKAALKSFTEAFAQEYRGRIYVGLLCPGFTRTNIFREQLHSSQSRLVDLVSAEPDRAARRLVRAVGRRKCKYVTGADAKVMDLLYRAFGVHALNLFRFFMQHSHIELFDDIFDDGVR